MFSALLSFTLAQHHLPIVNLFEISQSMEPESNAWDENQEYWGYLSTQETSTDATFSPSKQSDEPLNETTSTAHPDQQEPLE